MTLHIMVHGLSGVKRVDAAAKMRPQSVRGPAISPKYCQFP